MDVMKLKVKLMQSMYNEMADMKAKYIHKDLPTKEEVPFNIEYHIARYQVYRELLETLDKATADRIDSECSHTIAMMHNYIDNFVSHIKSMNKWINVEDGLPNEIQDKSIYSGQTEKIRPSESVLVLTKGGSYDIAWYSYTYNNWNADNRIHTYENWEIASWQSLPEASQN